MASPDEAAPATGAAESGAAAVEAILSRYRQFAFPQGEDAVADVVKITYSQKGEMWSAPGAKPMAFKADQWTDARTSAFRWVAKFFTILTVVDEYTEQRKGQLQMRLFNLVPISTMSGEEFNQGELQRYLAELAWCPFALFQHKTLEFAPVEGEANALRITDTADATNASVDLYFDPESGALTAVKAMRYFADKKGATKLRPWEAKNTNYELFEEGRVRLPKGGEVMWHLNEDEGGTYTYWRGEVTSVKLTREKKS